MNKYRLYLAIALGGILLALATRPSLFLDCTYPFCLNFLPLRSQIQLEVEELEKLAFAIAVQISSEELIGTGTLVQRQGQIYMVLTNVHVLALASSTYQIQTFDGRVYPGALVKVVKHREEDLAVLEFRSPDVVYEVATLGDASSLQVGERVFVGGFASNLSPQQPSGQNEFVFTSGQISLLLEKALKGGYQIGYTNDVFKGMSGGPLLNVRGELVGINSLRKDPLWDTPELYKDGEQPDQNLQSAIARSSMAVPITKEVLHNYLKDDYKK